MNTPAPASTAAFTVASLNGVAPLPQLGVIRAAGEQATQFLQGQLTQDMALMQPGQARLAGWCNPKGRLLASFIACKLAPQEFWLVCSRDLLAATLKKLSLFVLRTKVKLTDASDQLALRGLIGDACLFIAAGACQTSAGGLKDDQFMTPLPPADGAQRALWIGSAQAAASAFVQSPALTPDQWDWAEVRSGIARITQPVAEAFVPQMLNYESADGVNFKKGCYPGQEVVARSQYRGGIKRRAFVGQVQGPAQAGQAVFDAADPTQPVGLLAQTALAPGGSTAVIASIQLQASSSANLRIGAPDGPRLEDLHLPYPLLEDV